MFCLITASKLSLKLWDQFFSTSPSSFSIKNKILFYFRSQSTAAATPLRGHTSNGHAHSNGNTQPANDLNLAPVLFGVVIVFAICHSLRVFINIYDFSVVDEIISCEKKGVGRVPPAWIGCSIYVSQLLLMVNSSVNFLVYCVAGSKFRSILYQQLSTLFKKFKREDTGKGLIN